MKNRLQHILKSIGYELHRARGRGTLGGALEHLKARGFSPTCVIDGGASDGRWSLEVQRYFPQARYLLVEPLKEHGGALRHVPHSTIIDAALAEREGTATLHVAGSFNSSLAGGVGEEREVRAITLDSLIEQPETTLIKLDLEGMEYSILTASRKLSDVAAVILECSFDNLPRYCALMEQRGFRVSEIFTANFHPQTGDMTQVDILFTKLR